MSAEIFENFPETRSDSTFPEKNMDSTFFVKFREKIRSVLSERSFVKDFAIMVRPSERPF